MNSSIICVLALCMVSSVSCSSFKNCDESLPIQFYFTMPDPLVVTPGKSFDIKAGGLLRQDISKPMKVKHIMEKLIFGRWVKLPCIAHVGSCTFDMTCERLAEMSFKGTKCPILAGDYEMRPASVPVPDMPMPSFFVNGLYRVRIEGYTFDMTEMLFCGDITQEMIRGY